MNHSYQIALIAAAVFCVAVLGYFLTAGSSGDQSAVTSTPPRDVVAITPKPPAPLPTPDTTKPAPPASKPIKVTPPVEDNPLPKVTLDIDEPPTFTLNAADDLTMPADLGGEPTGDAGVSDLDAAATPPADDDDDTVPALPAGFRKYTVKPGDTFTSIATAQYGSDRYWFDIAQANPLADPVKLRVGDVINLPDLSALTARRNRRPEFSTGPAEYLVRPGDNLESIAAKHYNDPALWREIYRANRTRIGPNPDRIQVGMKLVIPPAPRKAR